MVSAYLTLWLEVVACMCVWCTVCMYVWPHHEYANGGTRPPAWFIVYNSGSFYKFVVLIVYILTSFYWERTESQNRNIRSPTEKSTSVCNMHHQISLISLHQHDIGVNLTILTCNVFLTASNTGQFKDG